VSTPSPIEYRFRIILLEHFLPSWSSLPPSLTLFSCCGVLVAARSSFYFPLFFLLSFGTPCTLVQYYKLFFPPVSRNQSTVCLLFFLVVATAVASVLDPPVALIYWSFPSLYVSPLFPCRSLPFGEPTERTAFPLTWLAFGSRELDSPSPNFSSVTDDRSLLDAVLLSLACLRISLLFLLFDKFLVCFFFFSPLEGLSCSPQYFYFFP